MSGDEYDFLLRAAQAGNIDAQYCVNMLCKRLRDRMDSPQSAAQLRDRTPSPLIGGRQPFSDPAGRRRQAAAQRQEQQQPPPKPEGA